ncbi:MAG: amidohydrolase [Saprospiraceae bacterium]|nr:amidohydrolase [Saprospiraceae bacterium]
MLKVLFPTSLILLLLCNACTPTTAPKATLILYNGVFFTADSSKQAYSAIAIAQDRILALGTDAEIQKLANTSTEQIDLNGAFVMPGLIEGHGHFSSLGRSLQNINLLHTQSWREVVAQIAEKAKNTPPDTWIEGRGWHQEKWTESPGLTVQGYPFHDALSAVSTEHPVILYHASGHALIANEKALALAGISSETPDPLGGHIIRDATGRLTGVLEENAMDLIEQPYTAWKNKRPESEKIAAFEKTVDLATQHCLQQGITSFQDAGSDFWELAQYKRLAENGKLGVRLWAMIAQPHASDFDKLRNFPQIGIGNGFFTARAVKAYFDGALGSYGAWLLAPYTDKPGAYGQNTTLVDTIRALAEQCRQHQLQFCVHAIGDRANREVLNVFDAFLPQTPEGKAPYGATRGALRWRVEHAQHIDLQDIPRFGQLGVIASMQAIHCTSDAPFVAKRLGLERARTGAYAWRRLLDAGARMANGTDTPVEEIDPFACLYASVSRKRVDTGLEFFPEQALQRAEALRSYTTWNAFAAFEEQEKGVLAPGKLADLIVLSRNLLTCQPTEIRSTKVLKTIIAGKVVYMQ